MKHFKLFAALFLLLPLIFSACIPGGTTDTTGGDQTAASDTGEKETAASEEPSLSAPQIFPTPKAVSFDGWFECGGVAVPQGDYATLPESVGIPSGTLPLDIIIEAGAEESYSLSVTSAGATVRAADARGVFYALQTLSQCIAAEGGKTYFAKIAVADSPAMSLRGVIEGFYGEPWTDEERVSLFSFFGDNKMNTYIYAPKDDSKHRAEWRKKYNAAEIKRMSALINAAEENYVDFVYALSPGLDIDLGSGYESDFAALCEKCEQLYGLGVRSFALFLDDISNKDPSGHARLLNDFQAEFIKTHDGCRDLICITTEFCDAMVTSAYTPKLASALDKDIIVMWTGQGVIPASIDASSLADAVKTYGRKLFIWWNYPVNDTMTTRLFLDGCTGLGSDISSSVLGVASNPMVQPVCSRIALFTIADFLWNPGAYDNAVSLRASFRSFADSDAEADALAVFSDAVSGNTTNGFTESVKLKALLDDFKKGKDGSSESLASAFAELTAAADTLLASENRAFVEEARDWLVKMRCYGGMGSAFIRALGSDDAEALMSAVSEYENASGELSSNQSSVSDSVLRPFFLTVPKLLADRLALEGEAALPSKIKTNLPVYQSYVLSNACDGSDATFFWSAGAASKGLYVTLDLGSKQTVRKLRLLSGAGGHPADMIERGLMEYSADGVEWISLGEYTTAEIIIKDIEITARYIRYTSLKDQVSWLTLAEFAAYATDASTRVSLSSGGDGSAFCDGDIFTSVALSSGDTLTYSGESGEKLTIYAYPGAKAAVYSVKDGVRTPLGKLDGAYFEYSGEFSEVVVEASADSRLAEIKIQ